MRQLRRAFLSPTVIWSAAFGLVWYLGSAGGNALTGGSENPNADELAEAFFWVSLTLLFLWGAGWGWRSIVPCCLAISVAALTHDQYFYDGPRCDSMDCLTPAFMAFGAWGLLAPVMALGCLIRSASFRVGWRRSSRD
jgi:hypothetical protein